jgi:7-cyano-7-deazaguanine synthase in queuosine biosynthesis
MRQHSVISRLGPADTRSVNLQKRGTVVTQIRFIDGERRFGFGVGQAIEQLGRRGVVPSEQAVDLVLLAATVTAADTRISRATESQDTWTREIDLYVPAQDPALWTAAAPLVEKALNFLTGDVWRLFFRERHRNHRELVARPRALVRPAFGSVCLFSGGLDSFTGAIDLLAAGQIPIFVSHYWDTSTSSQKLCANRIGTAYGAMEPRHVRVNVGFPTDLVKGSAPERTQRGRSFLFLALAALAASGLDGNPTVYVPENGLISLNVPLDPLRVGAWSTRTTHPFYMARWQEVLRQLTIPGTLTNPYRFKTKGEMLAECANKDLLRRYLGETISCSSLTKGRWKKQSPGHCGHCVPCLIRRSAIEKAFKRDPTKYTIPDLVGRTLKSTRAEGEHIRSFQMMARRLKARPDLARILVRKPGPLSDYPDADIAEYAAVFARGIAEVSRLVSKTVVQPS